jgi:hypothetical protein
MATTVLRSIKHFIDEALADSERGEVRNGEVRFHTRIDKSKVDTGYGLVFFNAEYAGPNGSVVLYMPVGASRSRGEPGASFPLGFQNDLQFLDVSLWANEPIDERLKDIEQTMRARIGESGLVLKPGELYPD